MVAVVESQNATEIVSAKDAPKEIVQDAENADVQSKTTSVPAPATDQVRAHTPEHACTRRVGPAHGLNRSAIYLGPRPSPSAQTPRPPHRVWPT